MVKIDKDAYKTKINMQYVEIKDPYEDEILNDKEFLQQFSLEQLSQYNPSILNDATISMDLAKLADPERSKQATLADLVSFEYKKKD